MRCTGVDEGTVLVRVGEETNLGAGGTRANPKHFFTILPRAPCEKAYNDDEQRGHA